VIPACVPESSSANETQYLAELQLDSSKIWPYFGIFVGFVCSNYLMVYLLVYLRSVMKPFWRKG
jgi:ATP-binding cassette subfamily G (WHITE) protein 2 (SNQ2)